MQVSFIEIYNETIKDLLHSSPVANVTNGNSSSGDTDSADSVKHEIRKDNNGGYYVSDVTKIEVSVCLSFCPLSHTLSLTLSHTLSHTLTLTLFSLLFLH